MPLIVNKKNVEKTIIPFLQADEGITTLLIRRGVNRMAIVLTNQKRVLVFNLTLVGLARLKEEFSVDEIESLDYFPEEGAIVIVITTRTRSFHFYLPFSFPHFPIKRDFRTFIQEIWTLNPKTRPEYLAKNENIIETIKIKKGIFKLTEQTLFLFKPQGEKVNAWEIQEKIPFNEIEEFDYYPETPKLLYLYIENDRGECRIFKIENKALFLNDHAGYGTPDFIIENFYESLLPYRKKPAPSYLYDGEEVLTTCRASGSDSEAVARDTILRVTTKRIIELVREKLGRLEKKTEIDIDQCEQISIAKIRNYKEKGDGYLFSVKVAEDKQYDFFIDREFQYAVDKLYTRFDGS